MRLKPKRYRNIEHDNRVETRRNICSRCLGRGLTLGVGDLCPGKGKEQEHGGTNSLAQGHYKGIICSTVHPHGPEESHRGQVSGFLAPFCPVACPC